MVACHFKLGSECDTEHGWWVVDRNPPTPTQFICKSHLELILRGLDKEKVK